MRAIVISFLFAVASAEAATADDWSWLAGDWRQCRNGEVVEEHWLGPRGGMLVGVNLTSSASRASFENLRIAQSDGVWTYWASPMGRPPTPFRLAAGPGAARKAVFENAEHGFPARISYWRDGADLMARIEGTLKDQPAAMEWRFSKGTAADCTAAQ